MYIRGCQEGFANDQNQCMKKNIPDEGIVKKTELVTWVTAFTSCGKGAVRLHQGVSLLRVGSGACGLG